MAGLRTFPRRARAAAFALALLVAPAAVRAGSYTVTIQSTAANTADSYLEQDNVTALDGTKPEIRLKSSSSGKNRHLVVAIPTTAIAGKTVLQAWLKLQEFGGTTTPIDAKVYPLTQTFTETQVCWRDRATGLPWTAGGGTRDAHWSDRQFVSSLTNNQAVSWQVGPIVNAWQNGDLANDGLVVESDHTGSDREEVFRSSEYTTTPSQTPALVVWYTDEAPAVRRGYAELQPPAVRSGATNTPLTLWLDVDASGSTPTGAATGFDQITITHNGTIRGRSVDQVTIGGALASPGQVAWSDDGKAITITVPRVAIVGTVRVDLHVDVLASTSQSPIALPVAVDDSATPSVWAQSLWSRDADGIPGNGDSWFLTVGSVTKVDLTPDTTGVVQRLCTPFSLYGIDAYGNRYPIAADSFRVVPQTGNGTVTSAGVFCATVPGVAYLVAYYKGLSDNSKITITPALTPVIGPIALRDRAGTSVAALAPGDTMFLDVPLSDGDGFRDVTGVDFDLFDAGHAGDTGAPAFRALYLWRRGATPPFSIVEPPGTSWSVVPELCSVDTTTNSTSTQTVRLAFRVGSIARASSSGEWTVGIRVFSGTPPDTTSAQRAGIDALVRLSAAWQDSSGAFSAGSPGTMFLPLRDPADGKLDLHVIANAPCSLEAVVTDLIGSSPSDTLYTGAPAKRVSWAFFSDRTGGGRLDTVYTAIASIPAAASETPLAEPLYLWIDYPSGIAVQDYAGSLALRLSEPGGTRSPERSVPLVATVASTNQAAQSGVGEVLPNSVQVGAAVPFTAYLLATFGLFDTGIDCIRTSIPDGYGVPAITGVRVDGIPVAYTDASRAGMAEARLASNVNYTLLSPSRLIEVRFQAVAPTELDSVGSNFVIQYDDLGTSRPAQPAVEGDADGAPDGNDWRVTVVPGPVASLSVSPDSVALYPGESQAFAARAADAYGHPLTPPIAWSAPDGNGSISTAGLFTASAVGEGRVIAASGGVADTARVTVRPTRGLQIVAFAAPTSFYQGQDSVAARMRVANLGADSVRLDTLALRFTRIAPGDADGDFAVSVAGAPAGVGGLDTVDVDLAFDVSTVAATGTVLVDGRVAGFEVASGAGVRDEDSETPVLATVTPGGISVAANQLPATVLPGTGGVALLSVAVTNHYPDWRTLTSLRLTNRSTGTGSADQLDDELGTVSLYRDANGDGAVSGTDPLILSTVALSGSVTLAPLSVPVGPGATARFVVATRVPLLARDGDALDVSLDDSTSVQFDRAVFDRTGWPLAPPGAFPVDGMAAAQVTVHPIPARNLSAGSAGNLALDVTIPANGYEADSLQRIAVVNFGTAESGTDITGVRAWVDDGDGLFDPLRDRSIGDLVNTGDRWQRTGFLETIPLAGLRVFLTVGISDLARQGRTVRFAIPYGLDAGVGVKSGDSGPLDRPVENPFDLAISTVDRVTLTAGLVDSVAARPGASGILLHHFIATNSYGQVRTLSDIAYTNATSGPGTTAQKDREIEAVTLYADADGNGAWDPAIDAPLGTSFFSGGRAAFTGLSAAIPPGGSAHFFLAAAVDRSTARDGDVLSAVLGSALDVGFLEASTTTAAWPVDSHARVSIDGMIAAQVTNVGAPGATLGPDDGPALALDLIVPPNGYEPDVLRGVSVLNLGSATSADIGEVHLYADGGDGLFTPGAGDDRDLGEMIANGAGWTSAFLADSVALTGQRLFVAVRTTHSPADSATIRLAIPPDGIQMRSTDSGPLDVPIANARAILISTSPLLATLDTPAPSSTVGQSIVVRMIVRNAGAESVRNVTPTALALSGTAGMVLDSGPFPPSATLAPAAADTFAWAYHSSNAGDATFRGGAQGIGEVSGLERRAVETSSNVHRVYTAARELGLFPVQSMPFTVARGQTGVVPFSLTLTNRGGSGASDIRLRSFRVRIEDESGAGVVPAALLSGVQVNEGTNVYLNRASLETSGSDLDLTLASPVTITSQEPVTISLRLDIATTATTPAFRVVIADSTVFSAEDATSGAPVTVRCDSGSFPVASGYARIVSPATELDVASSATNPVRSGRGAAGVAVATLRLTNPGLSGITSDVQVGAFTATVTDTAGAPVPHAASLLARLVARTATATYGTHAVLASDGPDVPLVLSPPLTVPANAPVDLFLSADVADTAALGSYRILVRPPPSFEARDASSRDTVRVAFATSPLLGPAITVEGAATRVLVRGAPLFPSTSIAGQRDVPAFRMALIHAAPPGTARLELDSLSVTLRDEARAPLAPGLYVARLRLVRDGTEVANLTGLPTSATPVVMPLGGAFLEPGDSAVVTLLADLSPSAPVAFLELSTPGAGIGTSDANTGAPAVAQPAPGAELPVVSGLTRVSTPARDLVAGWRSRMPAALATDGRPVDVASLVLENPAPAGSGAIVVDRIRLRASDPAGKDVALGAAAASVIATQNGSVWARRDSLASDSTAATLVASTPLVIDAASAVTLDLALVPRDRPGVAALRVGIDAGGIGVVQPGSALLTVQVTPESGRSFPFWTESGSFTPASLEASWGNFPNPFAAGREATAFVYYLAQQASVTLRIWTPTGERVATLADGVARAPGLHQDDLWDGRNGRGDVVRNGVYVAELSVHYADGSGGRVRRKVAVVR
ncbi:MAG: DNRLRE domain-containing protein [Bacteroidota bacterium]